MSAGHQLFVVSTGRTGTQFLARAFSTLGADGRHEPGPFWLRHLSNAYVSGHVSDERAAALLHRARSDIPDGGAYVESSCLVYGLVRPLLTAFPEATVVHVVRDPRTYVRSGLSWGVYRAGGRPLNLAPYRRLAPPQFDPWRPQPRLAWAAQDQFARLCWAWAAMNRSMRTQGAGQPRFRTVRFEDLTSSERGPDLLTDLAGDLDLEVEPDELARLAGRPVNASTADTEPDWRRWADDRLGTLLEHTGKEASRYGYPVVGEIEAELAGRSR